MLLSNGADLALRRTRKPMGHPARVEEPGKHRATEVRPADLEPFDA